MTGLSFALHTELPNILQHAASSLNYRQNTGDLSLPADTSQSHHTPTSTTTFSCSYRTDALLPDHLIRTAAAARIILNGTLARIKPNLILSSLSARRSQRRYATNSETSSIPIGTHSRPKGSFDLSSDTSSASIQGYHHRSRAVASGTVSTSQRSSRNRQQF